MRKWLSDVPSAPDLVYREIHMSRQSTGVKRWRKVTKERMVAAMGGACQGCGYDTCHAALEMHHIDPKQKDFGFGKVTANPKAWPLIVAELAKCVLVCANCHREIHAGVREVPAIRAVFDMAYAEYRPTPKRVRETPYDRHVPRPAQRKVERPAKEELARMVWEQSAAALGRQYGVSDNAIRKWCKAYEIEMPPQGYHQRRDASYSHEEALISQKRVTEPRRLITREIAERAFVLRQQGMSYRKAARTVGFDRWALQCAFERYGLEVIKRKVAAREGDDPPCTL